MPCRTNRFRVVVPRDVPTDLQWAYDTARPLDDDEVKKVGPLNTAAVDADDNVSVECNQTAPTKVTREVPYYNSAEEDEEEAVVEVHSAEPPSPLPVPVVELPNVEAEVHHVFPTTAAVPPPPPTATGSLKAMFFWHRHLVAHPTYERCVRFVRADCPLPPTTTENAAVLQAWMAACDRWWTALAAVVGRTSSSYKLPADQVWNPYSLSQSVTLTRQATRPRSVCSDAVLSVSSAKYFLPPPPAYAMVMAEYRLIVSEADAVRSYVACLALWWRKACQWAAGCNRQYAWVNPPPTTGDSAEDWATQCEQWRSFTAAQMREEERRAKAAELEMMMVNFQLQQQQQQSMSSSATDNDAFRMPANHW